ncbi:MAG: hypothetical protein JJV97_06335 [SAR324 cluster bacterium]|nr:hypothetical protein [SAR324 cluster bacterium]
MRLITILFWLGGLTFLFSSCYSDKEEQEIFDQAITKISHGEHREAANSLIILIDTYPNSPLIARSLYNLASLYHLHLDNSIQASNYYRLLARSYKDSIYYEPALKGLVSIYLNLEQKKVVQAAGVLEILTDNLVAGDSDWVLHKLYLGDSYMELKQYIKARLVYKEIIESTALNKNNLKLVIFSYFKIGYSFELVGMNNMALLAYQECENITNNGKKSVYVAVRMANLYERDRKIKLARKIYQSILNRLDAADPLYKIYQNKII